MAELPTTSAAGTWATVVPDLAVSEIGRCVALLYGGSHVQLYRFHQLVKKRLLS